MAFGALSPRVSDLPDILRYQFVQTAATRFVLQIVPGPGFSAATERTLVERLQQTADTVRFRLEKRQRLVRPPGIKFAEFVPLDAARRLAAADTTFCPGIE